MTSVRIMPLGGLGEIGMNCLVLEQGGDRLMIDCGVTFDDGDSGIDTYHPRFDAVLDAPDALGGIVVTHGHEDHIGAIHHLLGALEQAGRTRALPIWGSPYALALCRRRLGEAQPSLPTDLRTVAPRVPFTAGPFSVEPLRVTHSIPAATALCIQTAAGKVVHSGDFKLDAHPRDGVPTDLARLAELGDEGVALLMSDSTNVLSEGVSRSEAIVAETLAELIGAARQRVVVGLFASNMHRVDAVAEATRRAGRKLCLLGRSVNDHAAVARELGVLNWRTDLLVSPEGARAQPRHRVVYVASGTQGEARGALARIAARTHNKLRLDPGDDLLMSSRIIPGNQRKVSVMIDRLLAQGVAVTTRLTHPKIHASGHGYRDELRRFLQAVRPRSFVPLHGTRLHLHRHAALAREVGVSDVMPLFDGDTAQLDGDGLHVAEAVVCGRVATAFGAVLDGEVIRQRRQIGRVGIVVVSVFDARVLVRLHGVPRASEAELCAARAAARTIDEAALPVSPDDLQERIRRHVRKQLAALIGYKPLVIVNVWAEESNARHTA